MKTGSRKIVCNTWSDAARAASIQARESGAVHPDLDSAAVLKRKQVASEARIKGHQDKIDAAEANLESIRNHPTAKAKDKAAASTFLHERIAATKEDIESEKQKYTEYQQRHEGEMKIRTEHYAAYTAANKAWDTGHTLHFGTMTRMTRLKPENRAAVRFSGGRVEVQRGKNWDALIGQSLDSFKNSIPVEHRG